MSNRKMTTLVVPVSGRVSYVRGTLDSLIDSMMGSLMKLALWLLSAVGVASASGTASAQDLLFEILDESRPSSQALSKADAPATDLQVSGLAVFDERGWVQVGIRPGVSVPVSLVSLQLLQRDDVCIQLDSGTGFECSQILEKETDDLVGQHVRCEISGSGWMQSDAAYVARVYFGQCYLDDGTDLAVELLNRGVAWTDYEYPEDHWVHDLYTPVGLAAQREAAGVWAKHTMPPLNWVCGRALNMLLSEPVLERLHDPEVCSGHWRYLSSSPGPALLD